MTPVPALITSFLREHLPVERGCSPHTCESYAYAFKLLFEFASRRLGLRPSQLHVEHLDTDLVLGFLDHLERSRGNGIRTRNSRLAAIKAFMRFVEYKKPALLEQLRQVQAIPTKRHDQPLVGHLTKTEVEAVLNAPSLQTRLGVRDRAMIHLCFSGGLRVSELVSLSLTGLTLGGEPNVRIHGKGRKERCLPLWKEAASDLRAWLAIRGQVQSPEVFVNARGGAMSRSGFEYVLRKHVRTAADSCQSLRGRAVSPHQLRHSCAVLMLQATRDVRKVALWLGHEDIRSTEIYLRIDPTKKLEAIEAVLPLALRRGRFKPPDALIASLLEP
jgi:site-specific recombinase XerD